MAVARLASSSWNEHGNVNLVVGATAPAELAQVRTVVGDMPLLVPGLGTQGGSAEAVLAAGLTPAGSGLIINSSRAILYASSGDDFAVAARAETQALNQLIQSYQRQHRPTP
jgi:orotidine-5'-phosphate decarboxylase